MSQADIDRLEDEKEQELIAEAYRMGYKPFGMEEGSLYSKEPGDG